MSRTPTPRQPSSDKGGALSHEQFIETSRRIMAVPKAEVDAMIAKEKVAKKKRKH